MSNHEPALVDQLVSQMRKEIREGIYGASGIGTIPSTSSLAKRWNTSRATVYDVLQILQGDGLIRAKGQSLIVNHPVLELPGIVENFERHLKSLGYEVEITNVIDPHIQAMPKDIAEMFGELEGITTVHRMRRQGIPGTPLRLAENWYPERLAGQFLEQMQTEDRVDVVGAIKRVHGVYITQTKNDIIARLPTSEEMKRLEIVRNEPVIEVRRINYSEDGIIIMWNRIIHVAPYFRFTYNHSVDYWN